MSQIHFSLIFLKGENRRQKRKEHLLGERLVSVFREGSETEYFRLFFFFRSDGLCSKRSTLMSPTENL